MNIKTLIIGSTNPGKVSEWRKLLEGKVEVKSIADVGDFKDPEETGKTFQENAILKAKYYSKLSHEFVLADDTGLEIEALGGWPGVKSRRVLPGDKEATDQEAVDVVLGKMRGIPIEKRGAKLKACAVISDPDGNIVFEDTEWVNGVITEKLETPIIKGLPYRSIFFMPSTGKVYTDLSEEEHEKLNHRRKIALKVIKFLILQNLK
ncbi:MAG TPA: non-canonical purine NTP pyrophosphatase [Patescibacteria group bacterium]|nr:non-canonical purine NTP pyrophosphatase [Patescibacteria group bacterium]